MERQAPAAYAERLGRGDSPAAAREMLDAETRRVERVLLEIRLRSRAAGRACSTMHGRAQVPDLGAGGLVEVPAERCA